MAAPTAPTLVTITTEAIKKAGYTSTSSSQYATLLARAQSDWIEEVKWDIWSVCKKLTALQKISIQGITKGKSIYPLPTDFSSHISATLMYGATTGTAQAGAATSITLAASDASTSAIIGKEIVTTGGTGANQINQITAIDTATKVATVAYTWATNPASDTTYRIVDYYCPMTEAPVWDYDNRSMAQSQVRPEYFHIKGDNDNGEIIIDTPDDSYSLKIRYYADLMRLDLDSSTDSTIVQIYRRYRNVFTQGVFVKCLQSQDDARYKTEANIYGNLLQALQARESYGMDLSNLIMSVTD